MNLFRWFLKEAGLQFAFVILGAFLLLSWWVLQNLDRDILAEFKEERVSVIFPEDRLSDLKNFLEARPEVLQYSIQDASDNKKALSNLYPELSNVLSPLEEEYFPLSASISVTEALPFLDQLSAEFGEFASFVIHQAPVRLRAFLRVSVLSFLILWLFTMGLVLFFQLEQLAHRDEKKWSLMKMLGANPSSLFWPICRQQAVRVMIACSLAIGFSFWAASQFEAVFQWGWAPVAFANWLAFLTISLLLSMGVFLLLFMLRFRRVPLG